MACALSQSAVEHGLSSIPFPPRSLPAASVYAGSGFRFEVRLRSLTARRLDGIWQEKFGAAYLREANFGAIATAAQAVIVVL